MNRNIEPNQKDYNIDYELLEKICKRYGATLKFKEPFEKGGFIFDDPNIEFKLKINPA